MKCYAEAYCKKNKKLCSEECDAYILLRALYRLSRLPERYCYNIPLIPEKQDIPAFEELNGFMKNVVDNVDKGRGLYIWSENVGNGKTSWACKILSYYFRKVVFTSGIENEGLYIYLPTFLEDLRESYDTKVDGLEELLYMVKYCKLLIVDDIGAEKSSEWVRERMLSFITDREMRGLSTIYTSNLSPEDLEASMGVRVASRIMGSTKAIHLTGKDKRGGVR